MRKPIGNPYAHRALRQNPKRGVDTTIFERLEQRQCLAEAAAKWRMGRIECFIEGRQREDAADPLRQSRESFCKLRAVTALAKNQLVGRAVCLPDEAKNGIRE